MNTPALTKARKTIPDFYRLPHGLPLYWRDEASGVLAAAVGAYFKHIVEKTPEPNAEQLDLLWQYVRHHIHAPCWEMTCRGAYEKELADLKARATARGGVLALRAYVAAAIDIALDPF
jgi:hypothetical protein